MTCSRRSGPSSSSRRSAECYLTDDERRGDRGAAGRARVLPEARRPAREGDALRCLSEILWCPGRIAEAAASRPGGGGCARAAPPGSRARDGVRKSRRVSSGRRRPGPACDRTGRARSATIEIVVHALVTVGFDGSLRGTSEGERSSLARLELARRAGLTERSREHVRQSRPRVRAPPVVRVRDRVPRCRHRYCSERGLELYRLYLLAYRARSELDQGRWEEAAATAAAVVRVPRASTMPRTVASGRARARSSAPRRSRPVGRRWTKRGRCRSQPASRCGSDRSAAARAEAAWLEGRHEAVAGADPTAPRARCAARSCHG